ncbi:DNA topology modulation protein [Sporosarcina sp. YIM B06819]|uniref:DNA topology modulation protein n=1 Tax=Sporosarcina sp. YIM B06819 TaxID=3081769 RepID=UPI00298D3197|nr:DNA topology modulation protein [Sporosarcina sp. YIM B06819]
MKKIVLIGSGGSGKSTLARQLGSKLRLNVYHLDALFWKPNWIGVPKDKQRKVQNELVKKEKWVIDGNYSGTIDIRLTAADTIIFLDIHKIICVYRVLKRMLHYRNKTRPDMGSGCEERLDFGFLKWIWNYPKTNRPEILKKLEQLSKEKQIIILRTPKQIQNFLEEVK